MKNMKKNTIFVIVCMIVPHDSKAIKPLLQAAVESIDKACGKHLPVFLEGLEVVSEKFGVEAATKLAEASVQVAEITGASVVDASENVGIEAAKKLAEVGQIGVGVAGVGVAAYSITQLYPIAKEIVSAIWPSEEQKMQKEANLKAAQLRLRTLVAEENFRECIIANRLNQKRGQTGLPCVCEGFAEAYAGLGHQDEVEKATAYFNKCRARG